LESASDPQGRANKQDPRTQGISAVCTIYPPDETADEGQPTQYLILLAPNSCIVAASYHGSFLLRQSQLIKGPCVAPFSNPCADAKGLLREALALTVQGSATPAAVSMTVLIGATEDFSVSTPAANDCWVHARFSFLM
jgi:hypothetical protein